MWWNVRLEYRGFWIRFREAKDNPAKGNARDGATDSAFLVRERKYYSHSEHCHKRAAQNAFKHVLNLTA